MNFLLLKCLVFFGFCYCGRQHIVDLTARLAVFDTHLCYAFQVHRCFGDSWIIHWMTLKFRQIFQCANKIIVGFFSASTFSTIPQKLQVLFLKFAGRWSLSRSLCWKDKNHLRSHQYLSYRPCRSKNGYYLDANAELVSVLGSPIGNVMILKEKKGLYHGQPWKD